MCFRSQKKRILIITLPDEAKRNEKKKNRENQNQVIITKEKNIT